MSYEDRPFPSVFDVDPEFLKLGARPEWVAGLQLRDLHEKSFLYWESLIRNRISMYYRKYLPCPPGLTEEKARRAHLERLIGLDEYLCITHVWGKSDRVSDIEREAASAGRAQVVTRQSLSRYLQEHKTRAGARENRATYVMRAARLVDAMLSFQLLEEQSIRHNYKPLRATKLLDALIVAHHANCAMLLKSAIDGCAGAIGD